MMHLYSILIYLTVYFAISESTRIPTYQLLDGNQIPTIGFGTAFVNGGQLEVAVTAALENGYRHIDTATYYGNEKDLGKTLKKWFAKGGRREDLYITSKLPPYGNRPSDVSKFLEMSLNDLGLDYIDMYLIHHPFTFLRTPDFKPDTNSDGVPKIDMSTDHIAIWKAMEKQVKVGKIRSIGLSNFNQTQVLKIWNAAEIKPTNLQIENNLYIQQEELVDFCQNLGIVVTSFSPLGSGGLIHWRRKRETLMLLPLIKHPLVQKIAEKYSETPAQVLLRYNLQRNLVVIPKSSNPKRIKENFDILDFTLTKDDLNQLKSLDQHGRYRKFDFSTWKVEEHPEYPFADKLPK